jgi:hypothetical protein
VTRHLTQHTPAEGVSDGPADFGFDVISVKQMTARRSPKGTTTANMLLHLISLPRMAKLQEIFKLVSLCHIFFKVQSYKSWNDLAQCHNCQKFGLVWENCKQPPRWLWCGGSHVHKDYHASLKSACCYFQLTVGETSHPTNYRCCNHTKEEIRKKKSQVT